MIGAFVELMSFFRIIPDKLSFEVNHAFMNISANPAKFTLDHMISFFTMPIPFIHLYLDVFLRTAFKTNIQCKVCFIPLSVFDRR